MYDFTKLFLEGERACIGPLSGHRHGSREISRKAPAQPKDDSAKKPQLGSGNVGCPSTGPVLSNVEGLRANGSQRALNAQGNGPICAHQNGPRECALLCPERGQGDRGINAAGSSPRLCRESPLRPWRASTLGAAPGMGLSSPASASRRGWGLGRRPRVCKAECAADYFASLDWRRTHGEAARKPGVAAMRSSKGRSWRGLSNAALTRTSYDETMLQRMRTGYA